MKIISVQDGDTFTLEGEINVPQVIRIRLADIDAPERGEAFWKQSKEILNNFLRWGGLSIEVPQRYDTPRDPYNRLIAYVWTHDMLINLEMVSLGLATVFTPRGPAQYTDAIHQAQGLAQVLKRGVWSQPSHRLCTGTPRK